MANNKIDKNMIDPLFKKEILTETDNKIGVLNQGLSQQLADTEKFNFQSSFVETVKGLLFFKQMFFKKLTATSLEVILITGDNRHITHRFTAKSDGYLISFNCYTGVWQKVASALNFRWADFSASATGTWIATENSVVYTTVPGSKVKIQAEVSEGAKLTATLFKDDRGGLLKFTTDTGQTATVSVFSAAIQTVPMEIFSALPAGNRTITIEFMGADPANAPRGGTARGWLADTRNVAFTLDAFVMSNAKEIDLFAEGSNREFAFRFAPESTTATEWVPYHTAVTATAKTPPRIRLDGVITSLASLQIDKLIQVEDFALLQDIYGHHPAAVGVNLLDIQTVQSVNRQEGTFKVSGSMKTLQKVNMGDSYVIMGAVNNALFDRLLTGIGNAIPAIKSDNTITNLTVEADKVKDYAFVSDANNYVVAYNNIDLRRNMSLATPEYKKPSNFLQHRSEAILKHYVNIFDRTLIPAGFKYSWGGEYAVGEIEGIRNLL